MRSTFSARWIVSPIALAFLSLPVVASEWPQWLGPQRDAVWAEKGLVTKFPQDGPPVVWRQPIGEGYAGPAVVGGKLFIMDRVKTAPIPRARCPRERSPAASASTA